jgi:hypothetical protein
MHNFRRVVVDDVRAVWMLRCIALVVGLGRIKGPPRLLLNTLRVARGATATLGTGMKLFDESAESGIIRRSIRWVGSVYKLVAMVVHLH